MPFLFFRRCPKIAAIKCIGAHVQAVVLELAAALDQKVSQVLTPPRDEGRGGRRRMICGSVFDANFTCSSPRLNTRMWALENLSCNLQAKEGRSADGRTCKYGKAVGAEDDCHPPPNRESARSRCNERGKSVRLQNLTVFQARSLVRQKMSLRGKAYTRRRLVLTSCVRTTVGTDRMAYGSPLKALVGAFHLDTNKTWHTVVSMKGTRKAGGR